MNKLIRYKLFAYLPLQLMRIMKLTIIIMTTLLLQVSATTRAQVTLIEKNVYLEKIIKNLKKQSGYNFFYNDDDLKTAKRVSVNLENVSLETALKACFFGQDLTYIIDEKTVIVKPKSRSSMIVQNIEIKGRVTDNIGMPIPGVSVKVKGSLTVTTTDNNGNFAITVPDNKSILVFSFVGFVNQEIPVDSETTINVTLSEQDTGLDEVVVVAYGTQKKITVTGAIASIQTKEIKQSPAANLAVTLAGRLPGLTAIQKSGSPGNDVTMLYLRGQGTLNGQNPIILVDGVERSMTYIDPNEVESVTILKDASSTAIFGVRGANGVILVTTRRGVSEKPEINFSAETGLQDFTRRNSILSSYEWATLRNQAWRNENPNADPDNPVTQPPYSSYALERYKLQDDPVRYPNNNWRDMLMYKFVPQNRYNLNISGGGKNVQYFVNVGALDQGGQWKVDQKDYDPSSFLKRYNFRSNIDATLNKAGTLKMFLNAAGYIEKVNSPYQNDIFRYINNQFPSILPGPLTPDGEVLVSTGLYNNSPYGMINRSGYIQQTGSNVIASWGMEQKLNFITKGLAAKIMASFDTRTVYSLVGNRGYQTWTQIIDPNLQASDGRDSVYYVKASAQENTPLSMSSSASFESFSNLQLLLNYNRTFSEVHNVTGLFLAQQEQRIRPGERLPYNLRGFAARFAYGYKDRYFAEFNAGYNGSEQFAKGRRYGFFPSVSGAWVITNESFFNKGPVLDLLKLRASYGIVGNDRLGGNRFLYLDNIQRNGGGYSPSLGDGATINESYIGNPDIRWEVAKKSNIGLEVVLFNDFKLVADFFNEKRSNVLISRGLVPDLNGVPASARPPVNIGIVENKGYEIELNYNKAVNRDFSFFSKLNFNRAKNVVVFRDEPERSADYAFLYRQTGYSIGQNFGYVVDGYFNSSEEIQNYPKYNTGRTPRPGDFKYRDVNGDGIINDRDISPIGNSSVPQYTFGAAIGFEYKGFNISALLQGVAKVSAFMSDLGVFEQYDYRERHLNAWTPERFAAGEKIEYPALGIGLTASNTVNSFFVENTSFMRLKNVEVGYTLPASLTKKIGISKARFYVNGVNLFTWDKMKTKDYDPEIWNSATYPVYRVFNSGVNIVF